MTPNPYQDSQDTPLWKAIDKAVAKLVKNGDLKETTSRQLIVGFIAKQVIEAGVEPVENLSIKLLAAMSTKIGTGQSLPQRKAV